MSLTQPQPHAGNTHLAPVSQSQIGTRTGSPTAFHNLFQRLIDGARQASGGNAQAVALVQSGLPQVQRIEADFPGRPFTVSAAVPGPSRLLDDLYNACKYKSPRDQGRIRLDVINLRQLDQSLRSFGIQFTGLAVSASDTVAILTSRR